jgi:Protein of unknown function (DUF1592)/Protein of unknown function (DUF1588)/Protein of unknown function (DUF1595)/Protein of unknown function (DUF1585)
MKHQRRLIAIGALAAVLAACGSGSIRSNDGDGPAGSPGGGSTDGVSTPGGGPGGGPAGGAGGAPLKCVPGTPASSQIPRLLNRQYDAVVRDLLGVTTVGTENKPASQLLVADSDGPMTPDTWRIYQDVGGQIARGVMAGPNRTRFIACDPAAAGCLDQTIRSFGRKAFRRPLSDAEVARFMKLSQTMPAGTPQEVAETTLQAFLVSPSFIMVPELTNTANTTGKPIELSSHEVATRLSFMLWGSIPDDPLNAAADSNALRTKEQILAQAQRMIGVREKTGPLIASFHRDWVQMNNGNAHWWKVDHDPRTFPEFTPDAKPSWQAELDAFFEDVAFGGGSFKELLLSNVAFVNKYNAAIYGLDPARFGDQLMKVELDAAQRPGFLTRAGFLSSYSGFNATSPILRGAFISTYLLGVNPGPPIPGATMMTAQGDFKTQRAYVEALTKPDACVGCHTIVNPPGFVLENYSGIGKWQTVDPRGGAIDATVTTATVTLGGGATKEISSPQQLMQEIAARPAAKQLYAQAWVSYAFGRDPNANDQCTVDQLNTKLSANGYSILNLLADLTQADSFRLRARATP